ncbi:MAG: hypothetical protein LBS36_05810 [Oscillospiraceae bacterium]|jgi:hypothetical protein|nr:hypothetical protein [Oscillospiraceae bacterium]
MIFRKSLTKPLLKDLKHSFRSGAALPALFSLMILFLINNYQSLKSYMQQAEEYRTPGYRYFFSDLIYSQGILVVLLFAFGVLMGVSAFNFVNSKKMSNVFFSFNIKRKDLFVNRCIASVSYLFLGVLLPMLAVLLINNHYLGFEGVILVPWFYLVVAMFSYALIGFSVAVLAAICAGSIFESALYSLIFLFSPTILLYGADLLLGTFLQGFPVINSVSSGMGYAPRIISTEVGIQNQLGFLNPFTFLDTGADSGSYMGGSWLTALAKANKGTAIDVGITQYWPIFLWFGISALFLFTAAKTLNARKAENAGSFGKNRAARGYSVTILSIFAFCFMASKFGQQRVLAIALSVLAFFAVYFILEFAILRSFREVKSGLIKLPIVLGVLLCVLAIPFTGAFGYGKKLPDAKDVDKIYISHLSQNNLFFEGAEYGTAYGPFTSQSDIAMLLDLHKTLIEQSSAFDSKFPSEDSDERQTGYYVQYRLKDGTSINRYYPIEGETLQNAVIKVADSEYTKQSLKEYFLMPYEELQTKINGFYENGKDPYSLGAEEYNIFSRLNAYSQFSSPESLSNLYLIAKNGRQTGGALSQYLDDAGMNALKQCILNDYARLGAQRVLFPQDRVLGAIVFNGYFYSQQRSQEITITHPDYSSAIDFMYSSRAVQVTEDMSETVAFLREKDLLKYFDSDLKIVGAGIVQVANLADEMQRKNYAWYFGKESSMFAPIFYDISQYGDWQEHLKGMGMEIKTNGEETARLFSNADMTAYPQPDGYVVQFVFSDNSTIALYVPPEKMP